MPFHKKERKSQSKHQDLGDRSLLVLFLCCSMKNNALFSLLLIAVAVDLVNCLKKMPSPELLFTGSYLGEEYFGFVLERLQLNASS